VSAARERKIRSKNPQQSLAEESCRTRTQ